MSNYSYSFHKRMKKFEDIYPVLCPICMEKIGTIYGSGQVKPNREGIIKAGSLHFCSEKCLTQYEKEMNEP